MEMIPLFKVHMADTAAEEVAKVLNSGYIGQGTKVEQFETELKQYFNHDHILTTNSGTSALHLALHLLKEPYLGWGGLQKGDEVLTSAMTCTATNMPILANSLKIKWVDIDPTTLNMDLEDLERKITPKTKVIMLIHWGGYPNDLDKVKAIQQRTLDTYGFKPAVIEDGAHSFGSQYKGKPIGTHGNLTMYSLQAIKHCTSIDGGLLFSPHKRLHDRAKLMRWYGIDRDGNKKDFRCESDIEEWGFKFHMNDVNATVGIENLKHAKKIVQFHKNNAKYYDENLQDVAGVTLLKREEGFDSAFWIYSMLVDDRDGFYRHMKENGIMVSQVHERNDKHTCMREYKTFLPTLDKTIGRIVSIPVGWWLKNEDLEHIVETIKKGW